MARLRAQEVAALQRALESERFATRGAQERAKELQQALDSERSAARALRREAAAQARAIREEGAKKYAALVEQLRDKMELAKTEALAAEKESTTRALTAQFQRELHAREEEWRRETRRQVEALQEQLRIAQTREATPQSQTEALVHSLHAEFQRRLHEKQEEWRRETKNQVDALTTQLRELQRLYTETRNKLTTTTNEAETLPKLRQELLMLKQHNKELEEHIQVLAEADRRKVEEFRSLHEDNVARVAELQRAARKEAFQLLEEIKSKDRTLGQLQREYHLLATRMRRSPSSRGRSRLELETSTPRDRSSLHLHTSQERPGEPPRLCIKRPKTLSFASDLNKRLRAQDRKPPDPPEPTAETTKTEGEKDEEFSCTNPNKVGTHEVDDSADDVKSWTQKVGVETLYQLLLEEHQELQKTHLSAISRLKEEQRLRIQLEEQLLTTQQAVGDNAINIALAEQIQTLQSRQAELETEAAELREQNDLLEFRILELDDGGYTHTCNCFHFKSPPSRSPDTRDREIDDISDSGVMSLPTSEDISEADFQDFKMEPNNRDVKSRLAALCQSLETVSERISIQQALALLRHYETRLEDLEGALAAMCHDATQTKTFDHLPSPNMEHVKSPSRIIATVLPFTDLSSSYQGKEVRDDLPLKRMLRDQDYMQESGIFEDGGLNCVLHVGTQTDWTFEPPPGDLGKEIRKLTQIRERIEEKGGNKRLLKTPETDTEFLTHASLKELLFYRDRVQMLEDKLAIYESREDEQSKLLAMRLEKEVLLAAQVKHLQDTVRHLKEENRILEEEKCEFEEAENDTRLRCQKLEVKLSALGEKKSDLQVQLQQNARTMSNLRSTLSEEERKRNEARQYAAKLEVFVNKLEQQNFEMEEKEMEVRYRLHTLENVVPAMVMYHMMKLMNAIRPYVKIDSASLPLKPSTSDSVLFTKDRHKNMVGNWTIPARTSQNESPSVINVLNSQPKVEDHVSSNILSDSTFALLEDLTEKCNAAEDRIKELELKEKAYQETLQKGDDLFVKMEMEYKQQVRAAEDEITQKDAELQRVKSQLRKYSRSNEQESQLHERINQLEADLLRLQEALAQKEKEKKNLEGEKIRLTNELDDAIHSLEKFKENIEKPLREEVDNQKRKVKELLGDLDIQEQEKLENDERNKKFVNELKKINQHACRQLEENEVTISELREEVQTLEREVNDLRKALSQERDNNERRLIQVGAELEAKERQIRSLGVNTSPAGSLHEELLRDALDTPGVRHVDGRSMPADTPASPGPSTSTSFVCSACHNTYSWHLLQPGTEQTKPHHQKLSYVPPNCRLESFLVDDNEGRTSTTSSPPLVDCQKARKVVEDFDEDNPLASLDQLTSVYLHSRNCPACRNSNVPTELKRILGIIQKNAPQSKMAQINHLLLLR